MSDLTTEDKDTGRIEAFSDGVFAIAITLLVLELKVPQLEETASGQDLFTTLVGQWPSYLAYLGSFATILIMWVNHHQLFNLIVRSDPAFLFLNGLLLLLVATVPFPTALLAEYLTRPGANAAGAVYCGLYVLLAVAFNLLWGYAVSRRLLKRAVTDQQINTITRSYWAGPVFYTVAFALAFVNVFASLALCIGLAIFFAVLTYERRQA